MSSLRRFDRETLREGFQRVNWNPSGKVTDVVGQRVEANLPGAETTASHYEGCAKGSVELWTVKGGVHAPAFGPTFAPALWSFFEAHPKP